MRKFYGIIFILFLLTANLNGWGQVTIVSDGLNNSTSLFTISGGSYYTGNSVAGDRPATSPFASEGSHGYGLNATSTSVATATLTTTNNINTTGYTSISLSFKLAAFSIGSTGNGLDQTDAVKVDISTDGGSTYSTYLTINGPAAANAYWAYAATGIATTAYPSTATFAPAATGSRTTDGYSTVSITSLPAINNLKFRITMSNNATAERWIIDDVKVTGTAVCTAPLTQASALTFSSVSNNAMSVNWTNGSGAGRVVKMNTSNSFTAPTDGSSPSANLVWQNAGEQVVFSGTGSGPISITGLTGSTTYYFRIYEYCTTGNTYQTSTATNNPNSQTTSVSPASFTAGTLTAFGNKCTGNSYGPNSFTLSGVALDGSAVSVAALSGYTYSTASGGTYTSTLSLTTAGTDYSYSGGNLTGCTIYVKFSPGSVSSYSGNIAVSGGGVASAVNVAASGNGVNTAPSISTPTSASVTETTAALGGNITSIGCSNVTERGIYWSTSNGFADGTGTKVSTTGTYGTGTFTQAVTGLPDGTTIYFKAFATNSGGTVYTTQGSFITLKNEPTNFPASFACGTTTQNSIPLTWTDAAGTVTPDGYLIKWSATSYAAITDPADGTAEADGTTAKNIAQGVGTYTAVSLSSLTTYYFKIWSYTNSGTGINYKLVSEPQTSCTTLTGPCFSEDFSSIATGNNTSTGGSGTAWSGNSNFPTVSTAYQAGGAVRLGSGSAIGSITSAALSGVSGNVTVSFDVKGWTTVEGNIKITLNGTSQTVTYTAVMSGSFETKSVVFTSVPAGSTLKIETTANRAFIDNISLTCATACSAPATQASYITFSGVDVNSMTINWTNGDGAGRVVKMNTSNSFTAPADGSNPSASSVWANAGEQVVFNGTGSGPVSITGLTSNVTYWFRVYEYCATDRTYQTVTATDNPKSQATTLKAEPTNQPASFTCGTTTNSTIPLTWTDAAGAVLPDGYIIKWSSTSYAAIADPVDGVAESDGVGVKNIAQGIQAGSATSLAAATPYFIKIWSYSNSGTNINYNLVSPQQTTCTTTSTPTTCGTEDFSLSSLSASYTNGSFTGNNGVVWTYTNARDENGDANGSGITGKAMMFQTTGNKVVSAAVSGGIADFSVTLYKGFTGSGSRQVSLYVNGVLKGTSATFDDYSPHTFTVTGINISGSVTIEIRNAVAKQVIIDDISWTCYAASPLITTSVSGLTGFSYELGSGPSSVQSFTVSGTTLSGNLVVTPPADYEISSGNAPFTSVPSITLVPSSGTVSATTVYVRLKAGLSVASYNAEDITCTSTGATTKTVGCSGDVITPVPAINTSVTSLTGFTYVYGSGPSGVQSFTVSGVNLTSDIVIYESSDYQISSGNSPFTPVASITLSQSGGIVSATTIYVRLVSGLTAGNYNSENIVCASTGAVTKNIACSGTVTATAVACITEGFSGGTTAPSGWAFTGIGGTYTTSGFYGSASPSLQFDATGDMVETVSLSAGSSAGSLSFWMKGNSTNATSSFKVEGYNGTTWVLVENIVPVPTSGTTKTYTTATTLPGGLTKFRFTYTKSSGNISFDDVSIICTNDCTEAGIVTNGTGSGSTGQATISWANPSCYDEIIVVATSAAGITFTPSGDGTSYSANSVYAAPDQVVFKGITNSVNVTSLTDGTTYYFEIFTRKGTQWSAGVEVAVTPLPYTKLYPGDMVFVGFDTYIYSGGSGGIDKYSIATLVDILPGTPIILANAVYETGQAAYTSNGRWYNGNGDGTHLVPRVSITYNGPGTLTKGSVICITLAANGTITGYKINGTATTKFTDDGAQNVQISSTAPDAIWLMQGTFVDEAVPDAVGYYSTFTGKVLGGIQSRGTFKQFSTAADAISTRISRIHPDIICLGISTGGSASAYYAQFKSTSLHIGSQHDLLASIADYTANWTQATTSATSSDGDNISTCGNSFTVNSSSIPGKWLGGSSTDWFYCGNWDSFKVPDSTENVIISSTATNLSNIDINSSNAQIYNYVAYSNNLTIDNKTLQLQSGALLNTRGALTIQNDGLLNMTNGGNINLSGNWLNVVGSSGFTSGSGMISMIGTLEQIITTTGSGSENFHDLIINNSSTGGVMLDLNTNASVSGTLNITQGILDAGINTLNGAGNLTMSAGTTLLLSKNEVTQPELTGTYTLPGGTVILNGDGTGVSAQTIRAVNYYNLTSTSTGDRILPSTGIVGIANSFTPNYPSQYYTITGSTVDFNGSSAAQNIPAFTFYNAGFKNGGTKTLTGSDTVYKALTISNSATVSDGTILALSDHDITLHSDDNNTANVSQTPVPLANVTYGTGRFIIERYLPMQTPYSGRRWRLFGVPISTINAPSINAAWQEGAVPTSSTTDITASTNPHPGYGTHITYGLGNSNIANGFDAGSTANSSIYKMDPGTGSWTVPSSTSITITNYNAYMLFVRGNRSIQVSNQYINTTGGSNLRIRGKINVGQVSVPVVAGKQILSNPYPSAISMKNVDFNGSDFSSTPGATYHLWDPKLLGSKGVGAWVTFSSNGLGSFTAVPNSLDPGNMSSYSLDTPKVESGGAFLVTMASGGNIVFDEADKINTSTTHGLASRPGLQNRPQNDLAELYTNLAYRDAQDIPVLADGVATVYSSRFNNAVDEQDALKMQTFQTKEKISLLRYDSALAIERRKTIVVNDTIFLQMNKLDYNYKYQLQFKGRNFAPELTAYLVDKYLDSNYNIATEGISRHNFNTNSDPASIDINRFKVVFKLKDFGPLPVSITSVAATQQSNSILVDWKTEFEENILQYEVEKSADGINFSKTGTVPGSMKASYSWADMNAMNGPNYYRIKIVGITGEYTYSQIVKVNTSLKEASVSVLQNLIHDGMLDILFTNEPAGVYQVRLFNTVGQQLLSRNIRHTAGTASVRLPVGRNLADGMYHVEIAMPDNTKSVINVIRQ